MPSPVGHALGGVIVGLVCDRRGRSTGSALVRLRAALTSRVVIASAVAGVLPDLDFLWGRHNMETHSLGAAMLAGLAAWLWRGGHGRIALAIVLAWASHVLFDWLGSDDTPPLGVMALWPVTSAFYFAHAYVFEAISRRYWLAGFWAHNLWAVTTEVVMLAPVLAAAAAWRVRQAPQRTTPPEGAGAP
jgi:LexA-binding, inner membrane-associated putative hydrolase